MGIRLGKVVAVVGLALLAPVLAAHAQVQTSGGEVAPKPLNQKNVVDQLIIRDSLEAELAQLAASRAQNAAVKDYANAIATDARAHLENLQKLAGKADVGREAAAADQNIAAIANALAKLQAIPADKAAEFDRAFIEAQVALHESAIATFPKVTPAATDAELKQDIEAAAPIAQKHLEAAKAVGTQLAKPDAAPAAKPPAAAPAKPPVR